MQILEGGYEYSIYMYRYVNSTHIYGYDSLKYPLWAQKHTYTFVFGYYIHTERHNILTQNATCSSKQWLPCGRERITLYSGLQTSEFVVTELECEERPGPWLSYAVLYLGIRGMSWVVVNSNDLPQLLPNIWYTTACDKFLPSLPLHSYCKQHILGWERLTMKEQLGL